MPLPSHRASALAATLLLVACAEDTTRGEDAQGDGREGSLDEGDGAESGDGDLSEDGDSSELPDWLNPDNWGVRTRPITQEDIDRINAHRADPNAMPIPQVCSNPDPPDRAYPVYRTTLESLCEALAPTAHPCPANPAEALTRVGALCSSGTYLPYFSRGDGFDRISGRTPDGNSQVWSFDTSTGALLGVEFGTASEFACGPGTYLAGTDHSCSDCQVCDLCRGGTERNAGCPADVLAVLPSTECLPPMSDGPGCAPCEDESGGVSSQVATGMPCDGPDVCEVCEGFNFRSVCTCYQDGISRWITSGTE